MWMSLFNTHNVSFCTQYMSFQTHLFLQCKHRICPIYEVTAEHGLNLKTQTWDSDLSPNLTQFTSLKRLILRFFYFFKDSDAK